MKSNDEFLEDALIGGLFKDCKDFPEIASIIKAKDFTCHSAMMCWLRILDNYKNGELDVGAVYVSLANDTDRQWFMAASTDAMAYNLVGRARQIAESAKKRRIKAELLAISDKASGVDSRVDWLIEDLVAVIKRESGEVDRDSSIGAVVNRFKVVQGKNKAAGHLGMRTGFDLLQSDAVVYQPGHLWVVGGWTSTGKTAFLIEAVNRFFVENDKGKVAIFSTEMTEEQNIARLLANRSGVNANVILSGEMREQHESRVNAQVDWVTSKNLFLYDKLRNIDDIIAQCRKIKFDGGLDIVWIDFIQNVFRPGQDGQYAMMSQIARDLQVLAHDLRCTVVCLSQLPNSAGKEDSGILEFKGAGEIAAACDVGVLMKRSKDDPTTVLFDVRKNRHGRCGKYIFRFEDGWTRIAEVEAAA